MLSHLIQTDYRGPVREIYRHKRAALCMTLCDNYVITGSEDKSVIVFDTRANAILKTLKVNHCIRLQLSYPIACPSV